MNPFMFLRLPIIKLKLSKNPSSCFVKYYYTFKVLPYSIIYSWQGYSAEESMEKVFPNSVGYN